MKLTFTLLLFLIVANASFCQSKSDPIVQKKIKTMVNQRWKWKLEYIKIKEGGKSPYTESYILRKRDETDQANLIDTKAIILKYGFPGYSSVGKKTSDNFATIVPYFPDTIFRKQVIKLMEKEIKRHNASPEEYARIIDTVLFLEEKMQTYGTRLEIGKSGRIQAQPIQDPQGVDARRKAIGLPSMKDYLKEAQENFN